MARFKLVPQKVSEPETDTIIRLAQAGMSYRCIAAHVFGTKANGEPTKGSIQRVGYILYREEMGVTEYRNAENRLGRAMVAAIRREADIVRAIQTAAKEVAAAVKRSA